MNASHESALQLLEKANGDVLVITRLMGDEAIPVWSICFHAQQAVEKAIKAVLTDHAIVYPRTHNVAMLLGLLTQNNFSQPPDAEHLPALTPYGAAFRYEDEIEGTITVLDRAHLIEWAKNTVVWATDLIMNSRSQ